MSTQLKVVCVLACLLSMTRAQNDACAGLVSSIPVVDMCSGGRYTLGRVYIPVSSSHVRDSCNCTLRGMTSQQDTATSFTIAKVGNSNAACTTGQSTTVTWTSRGGGSLDSLVFDCSTANGFGASSSQGTGNVDLIQTWSDPAAIFSYCIFVQPVAWQDDNIELICMGGAGISPTSIGTTSTPTSTSASSTTSLSKPSSSTTSLFTSSARSSASSMASTEPGASDAATTASVAMTTTEEGASASSVLAAVVAVAVVGWVVALALAAFVLAQKLRRKSPRTSSDSGVDNSAYTSLSDVTRSNPRDDPSYSVIQSGRSSGQPRSQHSAPGGEYETVDGAALP